MELIADVNTIDNMLITVIAVNKVSQKVSIIDPNHQPQLLWFIEIKQMKAFVHKKVPTSLHSFMYNKL